MSDQQHHPPLEGVDELLAECQPAAHYFAGKGAECERSGCGLPREHPVHLAPGDRAAQDRAIEETLQRARRLRGTG